MMAAAPVTWFEVHTPDPETSRHFYGELFGWTFSSEMPGYDLVGQGDEARIGGGVASTGTEHVPRNVFCVQVDDVGVMCERVVASGGTVVTPAQVTPAGLAFAYVADPHGSVLGLWRPPSA